MNRQIAAVLFVLLVGVIAVGFYRSWFVLSSGNPDGAGRKVDVNLSMDRDKMQDDANAVKKNTTDMVDKITDRSAAPEEKKTSPDR